MGSRPRPRHHHHHRPSHQHRNRNYLHVGYETYEEIDDDDHSKSVNGSATGPTSYDILANETGSPATQLQNCAQIMRLKPECQVYKDIHEYVKNSTDGMTVNLHRIYKIKRKGEREPFEERYRILLWHGTSPAAIAGILQTGFRNGSGGSFGAGVYFADRLVKSWGYARQSTNGNKFFILAEVAPGKVYKVGKAHGEYQAAPAGFDTVKGTGRLIPTWKHNKHYYAAILPCGVTKINTRHPSYPVEHNEYIVYNPQRIIVRFIVECS